jgi:hypothetical protein
MYATVAPSVLMRLLYIGEFGLGVAMCQLVRPAVKLGHEPRVKINDARETL